MHPVRLKCSWYLGGSRRRTEQSVDLLCDVWKLTLQIWARTGGRGKPLVHGAKWTLEGFYAMEQEDRISIIEYLREAPLYEIVSVNDNDYLLTHSGLGGFEVGKKISSYTSDELLWNRPKLSDRYYDNMTTIFGHSPTFIYGDEHNGKIIKTDTWINIDVGTGYGYSPVLLRLNDMKEFR